MGTMRLLVALVLALLLAPAPAAAAAPAITCTGGQFTATVSPGLTLTTREQAVAARFNPTGCAGAAVVPVQVTLIATGSGGCVPALGIPVASGTGTIRWSNGVLTGHRSLFRLTAVAIGLEGVANGRSLLISGVLDAVTIAQIPVACAATGLTALSGPLATLSLRDS